MHKLKTPTLLNTKKMDFDVKEIDKNGSKHFEWTPTKQSQDPFYLNIFIFINLPSHD